MSNKNQIVTVENIKPRIFTIRGVQVMIDKDLAELYGLKPIRLREQVKRNKNRFPDDFMFRLSDSEVNFLLSQNAIPSKKQLDRFFIIDRKTVYHFGASLKDAGKKWFAFSKLDMDANDMLEKL